MGGVFSSGGSNKPKKKPKRPPGGSISATDRAVLDLKNARDKLTRYRSKLEQDEKKLLIRAKQCKKEGNTNMALGLLKLRKHKLREAANVDAQLLTVLEMVETISSKESEKELLVALKSGKDALEQLHKEMTVDDVLTLMDEVQEQNEIEDQINDILRQGVPLSDIDEQEVEAELEALEKSMKEEEKAEVEVKEEKEGEEEGEPELVLPQVPDKELPKIPTKTEVVTETRPETKVAVAS